MVTVLAGTVSFIGRSKPSICTIRLWLMEGKRSQLKYNFACPGERGSAHQAWSFLSLIFTIGRRKEKGCGFFLMYEL